MGASPVAGHAVARYGTSRVMAVAGAALCVAPVPALLAPHPLGTAVALVVLGAFSAATDIAMNAHGVEVERRLGRPVMSSLTRAGRSAGSPARASPRSAPPSASIRAPSRWPPRCCCSQRWRGRCAPPGPGRPRMSERGAGFRMPSRAVALLAGLCLLIMITEGAMGDWGGLYLRRDLESGAGLAALAYAAFAGGMTAGRLVGDALNARFGAVALMRGGAVLTVVPLLALLAIGEPPVALAGLFLVGLGLANGVPLLFSAAGRRAEGAAGPDIAAVSALGSIGFLAGPPFIGLLAQGVSLPWALATLGLAAVAILVLAGRAVGQRSERRVSVH